MVFIVTTFRKISLRLSLSYKLYQDFSSCIKTKFNIHLLDKGKHIDANIKYLYA